MTPNQHYKQMLESLSTEELKQERNCVNEDIVDANTSQQLANATRIIHEEKLTAVQFELLTRTGGKDGQ